MLWHPSAHLIWSSSQPWELGEGSQPRQTLVDMFMDKNLRPNWLACIPWELSKKMLGPSDCVQKDGEGDRGLLLEEGMEMLRLTKPRQVQASRAQPLGLEGLVLAHLLPLSLLLSPLTLLPIWPLCVCSSICLSLLTNLLGLFIYFKMADSASKCLPPNNPQSL